MSKRVEVAVHVKGKQMIARWRTGENGHRKVLPAKASSLSLRMAKAIMGEVVVQTLQAELGRLITVAESFPNTFEIDTGKNKVQGKEARAVLRELRSQIKRFKQWNRDQMSLARWEDKRGRETGR